MPLFSKDLNVCIHIYSGDNVFYFFKFHIPGTLRYYLISYFTELIFVITVFAYKVNELWRTSDLTPLQLLGTI